MTNKSSHFQHSNVLRLAFPDFHLLTEWGNLPQYKDFDKDKFQADLKTCRFDKNDRSGFKEIIPSVFSKYVPVKKNNIRGSEAPFMAKNLHNELMKRSGLRNKYFKSKSLTARENYNIQRNFGKKLFKNHPKRNISIT